MWNEIGEGAAWMMMFLLRFGEMIVASFLALVIWGLIDDFIEHHFPKLHNRFWKTLYKLTRRFR